MSMNYSPEELITDYNKTGVSSLTHQICAQVNFC